MDLSPIDLQSAVGDQQKNKVSCSWLEPHGIATSDP